ncbi:MAG: hypothetical protein IPJ40_03065 [Saprospirales bacterium]|nr:hypothetical protein [Saprospirales bacterium]
MRAICKTSNGKIWLSLSTQGLYQFNPAKNRLDLVDLSGAENLRESVFSILEDAEGTIWLGASNGLVKIIGPEGGAIQKNRNYLPIPQEDKPRTRIYGNSLPVRDEALWMVTSTNLCRFDPVSETFSLFPYLPEKSLTILNNEFPTLCQDANGIFWIGTSEGLLRFDPVQQRFRHFYNDPKNPASLSQNVVKSIISDPSDPLRYLWIGTGGGGLIHF